MSEADLARGRDAATADQARFADGVMGRAERPLQHEGLAGIETTDGTPDASCLQAFFGGQFGEDSSQTRSQEGLAGAGAADHEEVVGAGRGDGDSSFGGFLALHVAVVDLIATEFRNGGFPTEGMGGDVELTAEEADGFGQAGDGDDVDSVNDGGFARVGGGDNQPLDPEFFGLQGHRQGSLGGTDRAIEGEFADGRVLAEQVRDQLTTGDQQSDGDGQIDGRGVLGEVCRTLIPFG